MKRQGFMYDMTRCTGCKACQVACKEKHHLGTGEYFRRADTLEITEDGRRRRQHFSGACNHCREPACMAACPTGAMYRAADGAVLHDDARCIGCGRCVHHCPYGAPSLNKVTGYSQKCDSCRELRAAGKEPVCVAACPTHALHFGELEQLREGYSAASPAELPFLPPTELTGPSLLLRRKTPERAASAFEDIAAQEAKAPVFEKNTGEQFVILGGGAAAVSAAAAIRARNKSASIKMVSDEARLPYCRPMLSKGLLGSFFADRYPIADEQWLKDNRVELLAGKKVSVLDCGKKQVTLKSGETLSFDKCIYALGADCFTPPIPGRERQGVFTLRSEADIRAIRRRMLAAKNAVVIGGGVTGLEMAWTMKKSGLSVTVLDVAPLLMGRLLDEKSARLLADRLETGGVQVLTNTRISELAGDTAVKAVVLEDGSSIPAELAVISAGFRANTAIAQRAGLAAEHAVSVNSRMETSAPDIYACGDCTNLSLATWMQSVQQGEAAGANAAGDEVSFEAKAEPTMVHTADASLLTIGDMGKQPDRSYELVYAHSRGNQDAYYVNPRAHHRADTHWALCFSEGVLVGATIIGDLSGMLLAQEAVWQRWDKARFFREAEEKGVKLYVE